MYGLTGHVKRCVLSTICSQHHPHETVNYTFGQIFLVSRVLLIQSFQLTFSANYKSIFVTLYL